MKSKKKRGNRRKKKADLGQQDRHIRHERIGNMNYYGEEIARWFVEKLISLTITTAQTNKVYSLTNEICFSHCSKEISQYLLSYFLTHDKDELAFPEMANPKGTIDNFNNSIPSIPVKREYEDDSNHRISQMVKDDFDRSDRLATEVYYDTYWARNNFWGDIVMPRTTVKERYAYTQVVVDKYEPVIVEKETEKKQQLPLPHVKPSVIKRLVSKKDFEAVLGGSVHKDNKSDDGDSKGEDTQTQGNKKKFVLINLPSYDLPPGKLPEKVNELPNIVELRKERMDLIKLKEDEEKKRVQLEQHEKEVQKYMRNQSKDKYTVKMFPSNITTDVNGKVVVIHSFPVEGLSQEFIYGKSNEKDYKQLKNNLNGAGDNLRRGKRRLTKQQAQILKKEEITYNPVWNEIAEKYAKRIQSQQSMQKEGSVVVKSQSVNKKDSAKSLGKHDLSPSGSNFDLFVPEIGVTILEDKKKKTGGKDFFRRFNKISMHNFNQTLKDTLRLNEIVSLNDMNSKNNNTEDVNAVKEIRKRSRRNSSIVEPPGQNEATCEKEEEETNTFQTNHNIQNKTSLNFTNNNRHRLSPRQAPLTNMNIKTNLYNDNTMQMTNYKFSSVRMAMANLDLLSEADEAQLYEQNENTKEKVNKDKLRTSNIFVYQNLKPTKTRELLSRNNSQRNLNDINKFTNTILSHSNWGGINSVSTARNGNTKAKPKIHTKPLERDIEKEMGLGITMRKLPRSRMKKAAENVLMGYNRTGSHFRDGSISLRKSLSQAALLSNRKHYNRMDEDE